MYNASVHIEAFVIRKRPVREHDQLVVLYSRELGKLTAVAKGSLRNRSAQALALDEGNRIRCELVTGRIGPILTGTQAIHAAGGAKHSPLSWAVCQFFLQALDVLVYDGQPDGQVWSCLEDVWRAVDDCRDTDILAVFRRGQRDLLAALGYGLRYADADASAPDRSGLDAEFEMIAQRRLSAIDLVYDVAARRQT